MFTGGYWVNFQDGSSGYCEAEDEHDAREIAERITGKSVAFGANGPMVRTLPYPAQPIIWQQSQMPDFCHSPEQCAGRLSCPMRRACND